MKKISIKLEVNGKEYQSSFDELKDNEITNLENLLTEIAKGKCNYFTFQNEKQKFYFTKKTLSEAVISIIYDI